MIPCELTELYYCLIALCFSMMASDDPVVEDKKGFTLHDGMYLFCVPYRNIIQNYLKAFLKIFKKTNNKIRCSKIQ